MSDIAVILRTAAAKLGARDVSLYMVSILGSEAVEASDEILRLRADNEKLRAERDLWISRFEDFRKNAARLEEARSRPMRLVGSAAAALKETGDE